MADKSRPMVSIIIPVLNESKYIERCLRSLMNNTYDREKVEILVFDGGSSDETREIVGRLAEEDSRLRLLNNQSRFQGAALNLGIKIARGQVIVRFDGHAEASPDYIQRNIEVLNEHTDAWCVGGPVKTVSKNKIGKVIAAAMSCPIGVGNARFRLGHYDGYVETVMYGAYKKEGLLKVGSVDEFLLCAEDDDLHFRMRKAGGKFYLSPKINSTYYCRENLGKLWIQYFRYGYWRIPTIIKHGRPATVRQVVPMMFVLVWVVLIIGGLCWRPGWYGLAAYAFLYMLVVLCGVVLVIKKSGLAVGLASPLVFAILHFSYGLGSLCGIWRFCIRGGKGAGEIGKLKITR